VKISFRRHKVDKPKINYGKTRKWLERVIRDNQKTIGEITIFFCNDEYILEMNQKYLNHDYCTDILTFDYSTNNIISGDLLISTETVQYNAIKYKTQPPTELSRVMVHGVLHLLGFDDKTTNQQKIMRDREDWYLNILESVTDVRKL